MPHPLLTADTPDTGGGATFIHGSCVSRDAFTWAGDRAPPLVAYFARSSVASAYGSAPVPDHFSGRLQSSFQRRQVKNDFGKTLRTAVVEQPYELLLLDFIDERFPLYRTDDGGVVTISAELSRCGFPDQLPGRTVAAFGDEHFELWETGWRSLVALLDQCGRLASLRVNAVWWASRTEDGEPFGAGTSAHRIAQANGHLARLYDRAAADLAPSQLLRFPESLFEGGLTHRWGPAPFHYTDAAYAAMLEQLAATRERTT